MEIVEDIASYFNQKISVFIFSQNIKRTYENILNIKKVIVIEMRRRLKQF